jgi:hypothetical protein
VLSENCTGVRRCSGWLLLIPTIGYDVVGERMLGHFIEHDFVEVIELVLCCFFFESLKKAKEIQKLWTTILVCKNPRLEIGMFDLKKQLFYLVFLEPV